LVIRNLFVITLLVTLAVSAGVRFSLLLGLGLLIGFSLERFGFGFAGPWRRLIRERNAQGFMAQLVAIGLTAIAIQPIIAYAPGSLIGAIAPVSLSMIAAAFVFGLSMQMILGCGSGTLVNAGSGNPIALAALPLFCIGSFLGTLLVPFAIESTPHILISLPASFGVSGSVGITLLGLFAAGLTASRFSRGSIWNKKLLIAGGVLAVLAVLHVLVAGQPWGVVYGLGLWVAKGAQGLGWDPTSAQFWVHPINASALNSSILTDTTSLTSLGLIGGAALAAWKGSDSQPLKQPLAAWYFLVAAVFGLLLGISSRLAFGCNVGALFSGIASGSLHGWFWLIAGFAGSIAGVKLRDQLWLRASEGAS
jgi:uncharacterized membrane protein YedE/YeeE